MELASTIDPAKIFGWVIGLFHGTSPELVSLLGRIYAIIFTISIGVSLVLIFGIIYSFFGYKVVRAKEQARLEAHAKTVPSFIDGPKNDNPFAKRWEKVRLMSDSANQSDWKVAVMEADIMLEDLLRKSGHHGESLGEMLKNVDKGDMLNLDSAWEAHKVRNAIAHDGANVGQAEVRRVVGLYKKVFDEYQAI